MNPSALNLPPKFTRFRTGQLDAAIELASSSRRFSLLSAPTGVGKSLIYMTVARLLEARTLVLVGTKSLQDQLTRDFAEAGMVDVRGQSNYRCLAFDRGHPLEDYGQPGMKCDMGPCHIGKPCTLKQAGCLYYDALAQARQSDLVVTNYAMWMTVGRYSDPDVLGHFDLIIMDEGHTARDWLSEFCAVNLDRAEVKDLLGLDLPPIDEGVEVWASWAKGAAAEARERQRGERALLDLEGKIARTRKMLRLRDLERGLSELSKAHSWKRGESGVVDVRVPGQEVDWVVEPTRRGTKFSPVWAHPYGEAYLFRGVKRVVLSSATLLPDDGKYLGIPADEVDYHEAGRGFHPSRRPVIYVPTVRVSGKDGAMSEGQIRVWVNRMDRIMRDRLEWKGIIHTRSYKRAELIASRSRYAEHFVLPDRKRKGGAAHAAVEEFKRRRAPAILVAPAVEEGHDFPDDLCRWQIIAKVPFIDTRSPVVRARVESDKGYQNHVAALALVQMCGRSTRSAGDWSETFVVDDHFAWFRKAAEFPKWFKAAWRWEENVPPPMGRRA